MSYLSTFAPTSAVFNHTDIPPDNLVRTAISKPSSLFEFSIQVSFRLEFEMAVTTKFEGTLGTVCYVVAMAVFDRADFC